MVPKKDNEEVTFAEQCKTLPEGYEIIKCLVEIPRLRKKLKVVNFLLNFDDAIKGVESQIYTLKTATLSVKSSENFVKILRVVLAVVNQFVDIQVKGFEIQVFKISIYFLALIVSQSLTKLIKCSQIPEFGTFGQEKVIQTWNFPVKLYR
jgi:hypothetical protein